MAGGGVVEQSGRYVKLSSIKDRIDGKYDYDNPKYRDERVVYGGYLIRQWGHFLIEAVARLWYFLENDNLSDKYVFFVMSGEENVALEGNYKEFFRLLGILDKIEIINEPVKYKEVIVPQLSYSRTHYYSKNYKNIFSVVIENAMRKCKEQQFDGRVYFTRSSWGKAEFGLDMLDDFFSKNGFEIICPEALTLTQMIFILQKADMLAAVSGSTPHNILFGKDGQELVIIERCSMNNEIQADINRIKQLNVTYIDANMAFFPVSYGGGPFLFCCNKYLKSFAKEKKWDLPERRFMSETYIKDNIKKYEDFFYKKSAVSDMGRINDAIFREAYMDSMRTIKNDTLDLNYMIKSMEVAIIVSEHDFEKFLKECIKIILSRTIGDIEILCIDGINTDISFDVMKELQKEDDRILHIRDANIGCDYKLNFGISLTMGKYIACFKSDDKPESDMVEKLYEIASNYEADIIDQKYGELSCGDDRTQNLILQIDIKDCLLFNVFV